MRSESVVALTVSLMAVIVFVSLVFFLTRVLSVRRTVSYIDALIGLWIGTLTYVLATSIWAWRAAEGHEIAIHGVISTVLAELNRHPIMWSLALTGAMAILRVLTFYWWSRFKHAQEGINSQV